MWIVVAAVLLMWNTASANVYAQTPGIRIAWDYDTRVRIGERGGDYARMERVGNSDTLVVAYGFGGVRRSFDNGKTWESRIAGVQDTFPQAHPFNVELAYLDNGDLLLPWNYRSYGGDDVPFEIRVYASRDGGATWSDRATVFSAGDRAGRGVWEPAIIQLPSGELQLFAANEYPYYNDGTLAQNQWDDQEITMWRSFDDGHTWTDGQTVSYRHNGRDGMPVPLVLEDDTGIVVAIEDFGWPDGCGWQAKPVIFSTPSIEDSWTGAPVAGNSPHRWKALAPDSRLPCGVTGAAPYLVQFPQGETVLSFQSNIAPFEPKDENAETMVVAVGDDEAKNFRSKSYPYGNPSRPANSPDECGGNGVCGLRVIWNSLFVKDSTTVTAIASTGAFGGGTFAIDGYRIPEPRAYPASDVVVDGRLDEAAWQTAHSTFVGAYSSVSGTFHPLWDEERLILGCEVEDDDVWADSEASKRDDDGCIFDTYRLGWPPFRFTVDPAGRVTAQQYQDGEWSAWNPEGLKAAASVDGNLNTFDLSDTSYTLELSVPWSEMGGLPPIGQPMGINYGLQDDRLPGLDHEHREFVSGSDPEDYMSWQNIELAEQTPVEITPEEEPASTKLHASYPNPFRSRTTIRYTLERAGAVTLDVYDVLGRRAAVLVSERQAAGQHQTVLEAGQLPSGMYVCRLKTSGGVQTQRVTLM